MILRWVKAKAVETGAIGAETSNNERPMIVETSSEMLARVSC
jgi:hypothetical protein